MTQKRRQTRVSADIKDALRTIRSGGLILGILFSIAMTSGCSYASERSGCDLSVKFVRAEPGGPTGEVIEGLKGNYSVTASSALNGLFFDQDYVAQYAANVSDKVLAKAKQHFCDNGSREADIELVFVELSRFKDFDLGNFPVYGEASYGDDQKSFYGIFVWNPRQILLDQYWLDGGRELTLKAGNRFDYQEYSSSVELYRKYLSEDSQTDLSAMPPEYLWLFREAWQSTRFSFNLFADHEFEAVLTASQPGYSELSGRLMDDNMVSIGNASEPTLQSLGDPALFKLYNYKERLPKDD